MTMIDIYALVTDQGTATSETALCSVHMTPEHMRFVQEQANESDIDFERGFVDCSGNDELTCNVCGRGTVVPGNPGKTRTLWVGWINTATDVRRTSSISLTEGYTDESDIPKILAISHLGGTDDAHLVKVVTVEEEIPGQIRLGSGTVLMAKGTQAGRKVIEAHENSPFPDFDTRLKMFWFYVGALAAGEYRITESEEFGAFIMGAAIVAPTEDE